MKRATETIAEQLAAMSQKIDSIERRIEMLETKNVNLAENLTMMITDVDECAAGSHYCHHSATCSNTAGSYVCVCNEGFEGDGVRCYETDECVLGAHNCDANALCINTVGSYRCACNRGFVGDGNNCTDVNECASRSDLCAPGVTCVNTPGSYRCTCEDCEARLLDPFCPAPFRRVGDECFHVLKDLHSWHTAAEECRRFGKRHGIARPVSAAEPQDIRALQTTILNRCIFFIYLSTLLPFSSFRLLLSTFPTVHILLSILPSSPIHLSYRSHPSIHPSFSLIRLSNLPIFLILYFFSIRLSSYPPISSISSPSAYLFSHLPHPPIHSALPLIHSSTLLPSSSIPTPSLYPTTLHLDPPILLPTASAYPHNPLPRSSIHLSSFSIHLSTHLPQPPILDLLRDSPIHSFIFFISLSYHPSFKSNYPPNFLPRPPNHLSIYPPVFVNHHLPSPLTHPPIHPTFSLIHLSTFLSIHTSPSTTYPPNPFLHPPIFHHLSLPPFPQLSAGRG
ncbi:hypothetical protein C7M84_011415 [Penaeus vannamei]|uniref:EGF-like domain-containing protein n=1 Tax=Penaeus vannamei TaxID=6689 RepID=A0A3R7SQ17_PENVA|nr:hypothetical protein C7M84_011415 [Penaeus vannamei]